MLSDEEVITELKYIIQRGVSPNITACFSTMIAAISADDTRRLTEFMHAYLRDSMARIEAYQQGLRSKE